MPVYKKFPNAMPCRVNDLTLVSRCPVCKIFQSIAAEVLLEGSEAIYLAAQEDLYAILLNAYIERLQAYW